jgi:hypothetical protein
VEAAVPDKRTVEKAKRDLARGKRPSTAAGEFVREEIKHVRQGRHGARSPEQAIAIGLAKARRAGVPLPEQPPSPSGRRPRRMRGRAAVTRRALSRHAKRTAARRTAAERSRSAKQASATKGPQARSRAAKRAAATRRRRHH